jgi:hypothetical protein
MKLHDQAGGIDGAVAGPPPVWLALLRGVLVAGAMAQVLVAHGCHRDDEDHELFTNARAAVAAPR